jgi:hypothetical protein
VQKLQNHLRLLELEVKEVTHLVSDRMISVSSEGMQNKTKSGVFFGK